MAACPGSSTRSWPTSDCEFTYVDTSDARNVERAIRKNTRYVHIETPTNPLMGLTDIAAVSEIAHKHGCEVVVDNTFLSPYFQQPIKFGADIVMHSTTKFLNGHSDGIGGVLVCTTAEQAEKLAFVQKAAGAIMSPFECWLVLRGVKTLAVRMKQHDESGRVVADFLSRHRKVKKVFYPGLKSHPQYELACRQMSGFGSMITFETGSLGNAKRLLKRVRVCTLGESLGGVEIAHLASGEHDARRHRRSRPQGHRPDRWHGANFRGNRRCRGHDRRSGAGAGGDVGRAGLQARVPNASTEWAILEQHRNAALSAALPNHPSKKFRTISLPCCVSTLSGWNCTPSTAYSRCRNPIMTRRPSRSIQLAETSSSFGKPFSSTISEW